MKYVRYVEVNDNEGETWTRWIAETDPNLPALKQLLENNKFDEEFDYSFETYEDSNELVLYDEEYVQVTIDEVLMNDLSGYFDFYGRATIKDSIHTVDADEGEALYKLGHLKNQ